MIETEKILLRHVSIDDVDDIFEYASDKDTGPMAGWPPHKTIDDTKKIMNTWLDPKHTEELFAIVYKPDNKVVGTLGVAHLNKKIKNEKNEYVNKLIKEGKIAYEFGATISKKYWNKGISTQIIKMMEDYLFSERDADVIVICHYEENIGSKRSQEKNNYKVVYSYERDKPYYNTECYTMVVRAKTHEDWEKEKNILQEK